MIEIKRMNCKVKGCKGNLQNSEGDYRNEMFSCDTCLAMYVLEDYSDV